MSAEWHESAQVVPSRATRRQSDRDAEIERIARRQKQLIRDAQCRQAGLSARGLGYRIQRLALHRVRPGVLALHPPPYSLHQLWLAATYACGSSSFISDVTAAQALGTTERRWDTIHVTDASGRGRSLRGITVHRRDVEPSDVVVRHGIRCTSAARTIIDCASSLAPDPLEEILMAADSKRILNRRRLGELVGEHRGRRGIRTLRVLIADEPTDVRNGNELRMLRICRRAGVSRPFTNYPIRVGDRVFYADFCWPELRLIAEADSWQWHGGRLASEADADRDQLLSTLGWRVVHFTRDQIRTRQASGWWR